MTSTLSGEVRVLAVRLEVAAAERGAVQVDRGREQHVDALAAGLLGEQPPGAAGQLRVPGGGEGGGRGQGDRGVGGGPADAPDADRAVRHHQGAQADRGQGGQRPQILPGQETRLVVEAEGGEGRVDGLPFRDFLGLLKGAGDPS
ncbi:hypothetical protein AMK21_02860 [Streptomyces sp. CB00316]|nr:hypothetical protein AMK21_02860 [Streptomyces sp. CB00316]